jgi:hypothetical protein
MRQYLVDKFGLLVNAVNTDKLMQDLNITVQYRYGHFLEINNLLKNETRNKDTKYPLIALRLDTPEEIKNGHFVYRNLNIVILAFTDKSYNAEQRYTNIFKPTLYPIYEALMNQLKVSGIFFWDKPLNEDNEYPPHVKTDRPYWGTALPFANAQRIFDDPLDAIEISNLTLKSRIKNC